MFAVSYFAKTSYFPGLYFPPVTASTPTPPSVAQYLDVGGDGITMIGVGFVTLTLAFPNGMSMRTE